MGSGWSLGITGAAVTAVVLRYMLRRKRLCPSSNHMSGKTIVITGANTGLGKEAAIELARRKARVVLACRSLKSAEETAKEIKSRTGNSEIIAYEVELGSFKSIHLFAKRLLEEQSKIDVLINNAGVYAGPYMKTEDGLEMQMGVNHYGHFLLTSLLIDRIKQSAPSRIIVVSSSLSKHGTIHFEDINYKTTYKERKGYADSKLANLLFVRKLSEKLSGSDVDVFALHPGFVTTNLGRHVMSTPARAVLGPLVTFLGLRGPSEGCQPIVYCCVAPSLKGKSGLYLGPNYNVDTYPPKALDNETAQQLWGLSEKITRSTFKI